MKLIFEQAIAYNPQRADGIADSQMQYKAGESPDFQFTEADAKNLIAGGYARPAESAHVESESAGQETSNEKPSGTGSNDPLEHEADPPSLVCPHGCKDGKPFGSAIGLEVHRRAKH